MDSLTWCNLNFRLWCIFNFRRQAVANHRLKRKRGRSQTDRDGSFCVCLNKADAFFCAFFEKRIL